MRFAGIIVALAGCFDPRPPEGAPCGPPPDRACPAGQTCSTIDNRCYYDPPAGGPDSSLPDAPATCTPRRLLTGGTDPAQQGWTIERSQTGGFSISTGNGATMLMTSNNARQLIVLRNALPASGWILQIVAEVVASGGHSPMNGSAVIMASWHEPAGDDNDRRRMLVLDEDTIAWGEGGTSVGHNTRATVTYRLQPSSSGGIQVSASSAGGTSSMTAGAFTSNGSIAIGDQSTEPGLDSTLRLVTVDLVCP